MREGIPPFPHISGHGRKRLEHFADGVISFVCVTKLSKKSSHYKERELQDCHQAKS